MDATSSRLPAYLQPLAQPTPSSVAKLLAAWDGLHTETQIEILSHLKRFSSADFPGYLHDKIRRKALESTVPYVRYLGSPGRHGGNDALRALVEADADPLVRFSVQDWVLRDPQTFWALPHEARLSQVRDLVGCGKEVANAIFYIIGRKHKDILVSDNEVYEILADYLLKPHFDNYFSDGSARRHDGGVEMMVTQDFNALWHLVLKTPPELSDFLIKALPPDAGLWTDIPENVLSGLNDSQLETLLWRPDVSLAKLRHDLFRVSGKDELRAAALSSHFYLSNSEFTELLSLATEDRTKALIFLGANAGTLRLCQYEAIRDLLEADRSWEAACAKENCKQRIIWALKQLSDCRESNRFPEEIILHLRLYLLAREIVKTGDRKDIALRDELERMSSCIIEGDTWATFKGFADVWPSGPAKSLEKYLPRIQGFDPEESRVEHDLDNSSLLFTELREKGDRIISLLGSKLDRTFEDFTTALTDKFIEQTRETLKCRMSDIQHILEQWAVTGNGEREHETMPLVAKIDAIQENFGRYEKSIGNDIVEIRRMFSRLQKFIYIIIIVMGFVIWKIFLM